MIFFYLRPQSSNYSLLPQKGGLKSKNIKSAAPLKIHNYVLAHKDTAFKWGFGDEMIIIVYS